MSEIKIEKNVAIPLKNAASKYPFGGYEGKG